MTPQRIGLIGAGWISETYMAALAQLPEARPVAVWSRSARRAQAFARRHGLERATDDVTALLSAVDVVCVNSPNACHATHAIQAARAGKHVIVEKPLAVSLEQGEAIVDACRSAGVGLAYAEELAFAPRIVRARDCIRAGALGEVRYVTQREAHAGPYSAWFFTRDEAGGGVLMDLACHSIECVRALLGKPAARRISADLRTFDRARSHLEDHAVLQLSFDGGAQALCEASWVLEGGMQSTLEVWGSAGTLRLDLLGETGIRIFSKDGSRELGLSPGWSAAPVDAVAEAGYTGELRHFLECFRTGKAPEETGEDGLAVLEILCAGYLAARSERAVALPHRPPPVERAVDLWLGDPPT